MQSLPRATGKPEPGSREPPDAAPNPRPGRRFPVDTEEIRSKTYQNIYYRVRYREPDSREITEICRRAVRNVDGEQKVSFPVIWNGDIQITGYFLAYEITSGRILRAPDWHLYASAESFDAEGRHVGHANIPAMDLKQTQAKAAWLDKLGVTFSGRASNIKEFIGILAERAMREPKLIIQGQGPLWLSDGSPISNGLLDHGLVFVSQSAIFDTRGEPREIIPDMEGISASYRYYDITPHGLITEQEIREGIKLFREAFGECPRYPQIPAAMIGQLMTGFAAAIDPRCFSAILQSGVRGSGKTRYAQRWDTVQSRTARGDLRETKPVLNAGDTTGTRVGGPLRITEFAGFTITIDDVLKDGDNLLAVMTASEKISNIVRSYESGGGAIGGLDHGQNRIVSRERPALHSSARIMSEIPIAGLSTLDRLIILPHLTDKWGSKGTDFITGISERLSEPDSRELMHRVWSAYVYWAFQRMQAELTDAYEKSLAEISEWDVDSRTAERYAAVVTGLFMFREFCALHGADLSEEITAGLAALRDNARDQARANIPLCELFARDLRAAIINQRICWVGLPNQNPDDTEAGAYSNPWVTTETTGDDGIPQRITNRPGNLRVQDMGLMLERGNAAPIPGTRRFGYMVPPRADTGGHAGNPITREWMLALTKERFTELVKFVAKESGRGYDPRAVMDSLKAEKHGDVLRISWPDQKWAHIMDAVWALTPMEDEE